MTTTNPERATSALDLAALRQRLADLAEQKRPDMADEVYEKSIEEYLDPDLWQREVEEIFLKKPLPLFFSSQLEGPGSFITQTQCGVPVLAVRDATGHVQAFLNVCSHRGAPLAESPCGVTNSFSCVYHGWTYDLEGRLRGIAEERTFGDVDKARHGLVPLPTEEYAGLIWVVLTPGAELDLPAWLGPIAPVLEAAGLDRYQVALSANLPGPNWKLTIETYLEMYHFLTLHTDSLSKRMVANRMGVDDYYPHQRNLLPEKSGKMAVVVVLFPSIVFAVDLESTAADHGHPLTFHLITPGADPGSSMTVQHILTAEKLDSEADRQYIREFRDLVNKAVVDEDLRMAFGIQAGARSHARAGRVRLFGRCEPGLQLLHRNLERVLAESEGSDQSG